MNALKNKWVWFGAGLIIGIPVVAIGWWLLAPLFLDTEVDEAFPLTENATIPAGISQSEAETVMMTMAKVETKMDEEMPKEMMEASNVVVKSGNFRDGDSFPQGRGQGHDLQARRRPASPAFRGLQGLQRPRPSGPAGEAFQP